MQIRNEALTLPLIASKIYTSLLLSNRKYLETWTFIKFKSPILIPISDYCFLYFTLKLQKLLVFWYFRRHRKGTLALNALMFTKTEAVAWRCSVKKVILKVFKTETLAQVFSCEFCEIFKNTFFYRATPAASFTNSSLF